MKKHRILRNILIDAVCAGLALVVFALYHHVLPRQEESLGIVIANPYETKSGSTMDAAQTDTGKDIQASVRPENSNRIASAGVDDVSSATPVRSGSKPDRDSKAASDSKTDGDSDKGSSSETGGSSPESSDGRMSGRGPKSSGIPSGSGNSKSSSSKSSGRGGKSGGMNGKGGSALTTDSPEITVEAENTPISGKFADQYTDTVVTTENSYSSPDISITVTEETYGRATYYLADIYVRDITCFQTALAGNTYGSGYRDSIEDMADLANALLAVNGDYYGNTNEGVVIRNGVIYRANDTSCDVCVLYYDGTMRVTPGSSFSVEDAVADGAWQAWTFGPALLDTDGSVLTSFSSTGRIIAANPRTAIGYYEPGHYCLVVVDGRGESAGLTLPDLSQLFHDLGCTAAYNLDGGNSSIMVWNGETINDPSGGGRESSDALMIAEVKRNE